MSEPEDGSKKSPPASVIEPGANYHGCGPGWAGVTVGRANYPFFQANNQIFILRPQGDGPLQEPEEPGTPHLGGEYQHDGSGRLVHRELMKALEALLAKHGVARLSASWIFAPKAP